MNAKFKVKFKGWNPRFFASYEEAMDFIKKANIILDGFWSVEIYEDNLLVGKFNTFDFNDIKPLKPEFPQKFVFTSSRGADVNLTLEEDTDSTYDIIISVIINGEKVASNVKARICAFIGTKAPDGAFLMFTNPKNNRQTAICINDCPELLKYLFAINKNRNILENYI